MTTVLHVGRGVHTPDKIHETFRGEFWREVRLDINLAVRPDTVASIPDIRNIPDASFEALYSSHNFEYLHPYEEPLVLVEFKQVQNPLGFALVTVPDLQQAARFVAEEKTITEQEAHAVLEKAKYGLLGTVSPKNKPYVVPLSFSVGLNI